MCKNYKKYCKKCIFFNRLDEKLKAYFIIGDMPEVINVTKLSMLLISYHDLSSFKIYLNDVGLLRKIFG